jgi:hypothetical protein
MVKEKHWSISFYAVCARAALARFFAYFTCFDNPSAINQKKHYSNIWDLNSGTGFCVNPNNFVVGVPHFF